MPTRDRKFTWDAWDFDGEGNSYVIAKRECKDIDLVPEFICDFDWLRSDCMESIRKSILSGWASYQVRSDWEDHEGERLGGYYVVQQENKPKRGRGWFPVWIVRKGAWY